MREKLVTPMQIRIDADIIKFQSVYIHRANIELKDKYSTRYFNIMIIVKTANIEHTMQKIKKNKINNDKKL